MLEAKHRHPKFFRRRTTGIWHGWRYLHYRFANLDSAASDHLGIDAAFVVAEPAHQCSGDIEVARGGVGVDVDGDAAGDPLHHLQARLADGEDLAEQFELVPGRPALDI